MRSYNSNRQRSILIVSLGIISAILAILCSKVMATNQGKNDPASTSHTTLTIEGSSPSIFINVCHEGSCKTIAPPQKMLDSISDGYSEITLEDLTQDGRPEIILTHSEEGSVNTCSEVYQYKEELNTIIHINNLHNQLCNYSTKNDSVISSYRSGAKWHEDIYKVKDNSLVLELTDSCIGCNYIDRTIYHSSGKSEHLLVTDNLDYALRNPISTKVITQKAMLYNEPRTDHITKMYLITGDEVILTNFASTEDDSFWYKIRYVTQKGKVIRAWLKCADIDFCENDRLIEK
ncbi:hypothetical protein HP532_01490 [Pseudomonas sp. CrR25]|nr:hypothetical protein [Pseudomonas sp. CrR25]